MILIFFQRYPSVRTEKLHSLKVRKSFEKLESFLFCVKIGYKLILKKVCNTHRARINDLWYCISVYDVPYLTFDINK